MEIIFKEVNSKNWEQCISLKVSKEQENFVAPNWYSLLEAKFYEEEKIYPMAIYDGDTMVGFLMYCLDREDGRNRWEMCRLMIGTKYQSKGYGRKSVSKLLDYIKEKYGNIEFYTSIEPENIVAQKLYESVGFKKTGEVLWDEEVMFVQL